MKIPLPFVLPLAMAVACIAVLPSCSKKAKVERSLETAIESFEKGDFAVAEIEFKNTLKSDQKNSEAFKYMGMIREKQGNPFEAIRMLSYAKEKLPTDNLVGVKFAQATLALGFLQDSRKELIAILDRSPSDGEALVLFAESSFTPEWMKECEERIQKADQKSTSARLASALLALRRGEIDKGADAVDDILISDPKSARAHALKAAVLDSSQQPEAALDFMSRAAGLAGSRSNESIAYARKLMSRGRRDEAVTYLTQIATKTPDFLPVWATLGQIAISDKNDELATQHFVKVLSKNPFDINSAMSQAEVHLRAKQPEKAVEVLEKVTNALPFRPKIEFVLAQAYLASKKEAKAGAALDRTLAAAPEFNEAATLRAQVHLREGKTTDAISLLEGVRNRKPTDAANLDLLIQAYRSAGFMDNAVALLRERVKGDGQTTAAKIELGQILAAQGKFDEARSVFEGIIKLSPESLPAVSNLAIIDFQQGKGDAALKRLEDFVLAHPTSAEAYTFKGQLELSLKTPEVAEKSLRKAIELEAKSAQAYAILLQIKSARGQETEALTILESYLKAYPEDPQALLKRGYLLQVLGRHDEARAAFLALIEAQPDFAPAYNNMATLEAEEFKNLQAAEGYARKAYALDPAQPAIADTLGWIEWQLGNFSAALPLLEVAAEKLSNNPVVLYHHAMAQYSMGQAAEATASFKQVIATEGDVPQKADAQKYLSLLEQSDKATPADLEELKKRIAENPKDIMAHLQLAQGLARSERYPEALDAYQAAFTANPAVPAALIGKARLYAGPLKSPEKALESATAARELAPRDPHVLAALGAVKLQSGAHEEAYGMLKDATTALESDFTVAYDYARAAYSLGRIQEARAAMTRVAASSDSSSADAGSFLILTDSQALEQTNIAAEVEKALAQNPQNVAALMLRSSLDSAAGKNPEATYLEVLKLQPRFDPARVRLAGIYVEDPAKLDQALELATEARSRLADDAELTRIFAIGNYRKGDFNYAAQLMSEISIKRPLATDELFVLGMSLAKSKQPEKARETLEKALTAGLPEPSATEAKDTLAKLDEPKEED